MHKSHTVPRVVLFRQTSQAKKDSRALLRLDSAPMCDVCSLFFMTCRSFAGTTTRSPRNTSPSYMDSSSLVLVYGRTVEVRVPCYLANLEEWFLLGAAMLRWLLFQL